MNAGASPLAQGLVAAVLVAVFVLLARDAAHRVLVAMGAVALLWTVTYLTPLELITFEASMRALDFNVLVLLAAMMALVGVLKTTGVFEWAVVGLVLRARGRPLAVLTVVSVFTAVTSAFLDNVTTVIFVTPMVVGVARRLGMPPAPFLLPMVMASNIGGTATLIGDPPNIMIGSGAGLSFVDFLIALTLPCAVMMLWLDWFSRRYYRAAYAAAAPRAGIGTERSDVELANPLLGRWMAGICLAVLVGFLTHHVTHMPPAVPALVGAAAALIAQDVIYLRRQHPTAQERLHGVLRVTEEDIEWPTLAFFGFLFIAVGAAVETGLIGSVARGLEWAIDRGAGGLGLGPTGTLAFAALVICWVAGVLSALVDNIPFVAVSIPIVTQLAQTLPGDTTVLWWALALGACLGGNGTAIGASANVTAIGLAERDGTRVSFGEFARFGVPVTAGTLVIASLYLLAYALAGAWAATSAAAAAFGLLVVASLLGRATARPPASTR